jgi:hypothetical protein
MKYDLFELLNAAIQTNIPVIIVEGKDDPQIYYRIADKANKIVDIYLINNIENYYSGCDNVIKCISELQPKYEEREENVNRIIGIIDRDVRPYRELRDYEVDYRELKGLFVLKYYSYETYFATETILKNLLLKLTHITSKEIDSSIFPFLIEKFENTKQDLYYISLEVLKNSCEEHYISALGYSDDSVKEVKARQHFLSLISHKIPELDNFAISKSISIYDLKLICKGKWYLYVYLSKANEQIKKLSEKCKNGEIVQCNSCKIGNNEDCGYTYKTGYQINSIYNDVFEYIDEMECSDIIERFKQLI